jgi:hypothetical protein
MRLKPKKKEKEKEKKEKIIEVFTEYLDLLPH